MFKAFQREGPVTVVILFGSNYSGNSLWSKTGFDGLLYCKSVQSCGRVYLHCGIFAINLQGAADESRIDKSSSSEDLLRTSRTPSLGVDSPSEVCLICI